MQNKSALCGCAEVAATIVIYSRNRVPGHDRRNATNFGPYLHPFIIFRHSALYRFWLLQSSLFNFRYHCAVRSVFSIFVAYIKRLANVLQWNF